MPFSFKMQSVSTIHIVFELKILVLINTAQKIILILRSIKRFTPLFTISHSQRLLSSDRAFHLSYLHCSQILLSPAVQCHFSPAFSLLLPSSRSSLCFSSALVTLQPTSLSRPRLLPAPIHLQPPSPIKNCPTNLSSSFDSVANSPITSLVPYNFPPDPAQTKSIPALLSSSSVSAIPKMLVSFFLACCLFPFPIIFRQAFVSSSSKRS